MTDLDEWDRWEGFDTVAPPEPEPGDQTNPFRPDSPEYDAWQQQENTERAAHKARRQRELTEAETERQLLLLRAKKKAQELFNAEQAGMVPVPSGISLTELLARPIEPARYRIDGLWPRHGNVMLSAQYKAGKTTTRDNLVRSLVDGEPFLGNYQVEPVDNGRVGVLDTEMAENKLQEWLRDQGIHNSDQLILWPLRGRVRAFDILNEQVRLRWVEQIKAAEIRVMVLDVLGPVLGALDLDENKNPDVIRFFAAFDATMAEAGVEETVVVHHMGHGAERSRGASRLRDWPDAEWRLVRQKDEDNPFGDADPSAPRFFSAFGRDVDVREGQITFDPLTRRLRYAEGNRKQARANAALMFVLGFVKDHPSSSVRAIQDASQLADGVTRDAARDAVKHAVREGFLAVADGPNRSNLHTLTAPGFSALRGDF